MATLWTNLEARRDAIGVELAALASTTAGGKPNTSGQGEHVDHVGYKASLYAELKEINALLATRPFQIETEVNP